MSRATVKHQVWVCVEDVVVKIPVYAPHNTDPIQIAATASEAIGKATYRVDGIGDTFTSEEIKDWWA